ncbi:MAG: pyridoxal phosphate-dependent aminotransferase [Rhodothermaceae bacterium]|nr:pyridoxal phosphate-dependent aminotransferase [Rhodothermaceae bacterium]MXZ57218.1 pyridoxal phosphate-dependent aminotransferase [Rhodothermaceae bacterium]MYB90915.1 pyridoxal phosphate-dependent aminotransferase [Rhodothermaceae bacterium]MYD67790.1 pyridoxal phosphate-dependent aminotransferase [Rhodothermaceae bacterium]MYG45085.1 pyridoxal phosphate-dependent aminotransferase [Rhodothermaceae bacterium]
MMSVQMPVMGFVADLMRENPGTISLGQGVVHYGPPAAALEAAAAAVTSPDTHGYGYVIGRPELRSAFAQKLTTENRLDPGYEVVVTAGSNMAFFASLLAVTSPGDEVILLVPYYFNHEMATRIADCTPVLVTLDDSLIPDVSAVERAITPRTRAIVTISPNNPTGVVYPPETLRAINDLCARHGIYHMSDEAYEYFTFDGAEHYSPGSAPGAHAHTISLFSMSKAYGMAGWRLGYMAIPPHILADVRKIQDTNQICPAILSQVAALKALEDGGNYCKQYVSSMAKVRAMVLRRLRSIQAPVTISPSDGAFYFLLSVDSQLDAKTLTTRLIQEYGVAVIPGDTFGMEGVTSLRIAYGALQESTLTRAIDRLVRGLEALTG